MYSNSSSHRTFPLRRTSEALLLAALLFWVGCTSEGERSPGRAEPSPIAEDRPSVAVVDWSPGHHGSWLGAQPPVPLNLLLISLDTTRQDHLSCYGFEDSTTPHLDRLAEEGILFARGTAPVPITLPSHSTMMTGLYPFHHGVRNNGSYQVADTLETLAETLRRNGYRTGAITAAFPVAAQFGLDQGFDRYDDDYPASSVTRETDTAQRVAEDVTTRALDFLDAGTDRFFVWAHYFDPHYPYEPPEPYGTRFQDPYAGEIAYMDAQIGRLIEGLRQRDLLERTVIMVAGDHGESLGEHGELTHSFFVYNATQYVPYLIRLPSVEPFERGWRGQRVEGLVSLADLFPTALDALGLPRSELPPVDGKSLLPVIRGDEPAHSWVYYETVVPAQEYGASELRALETKRWKYIRAPRPELYDLEADPKETRNLAQQTSWEVEALESQLASLLRGERAEDAQVAMNAETVEKLQSLGYLAGSPPDSESDGPPVDPKDRIRSVRMLNVARTRLAEHRPERALALVDSVLDRFPQDGRALRLRASALARAKRYQDALDTYDKILEHCHRCTDLTHILMNRAETSLLAGNAKSALADLDALIETDPTHRGLHLRRARVHAELEDFQQAERDIERELEFFPKRTAPLLLLAEIRIENGDRDAAERVFRRALETNPEAIEAQVGLGMLLLQSDRNEEGKQWIEKAFALDPNLPTVLFARGWIALQEGDDERALQSYLAGLERDPNHAEALFNAGTIAMGRGRLSRALELFDRAIATGEAPVGALANGGVVHAQQGRLEQAVDYWERALSMDPDPALAAQVRANIERARSQIQ